LSECDITTAIKPIDNELMKPGKTYMSYSYYYTGCPYDLPNLQYCLDNKISLLDYEMMRDE